jgi:WD40 repeat protein
MEAEQVYAQLDRILGSAAFAEAERARKFLRFVVELALAGREQEIKEGVVAVEVLGRRPSFDSRTDPIVRVEAGRLRARLLTYYQSEGVMDGVLIELPKGGYVPQFQERPSGEQNPIPRQTAYKRRHLGAAGLFVLLLFWVIWRLVPVAAPRQPALRLSVIPIPNSDIRNSAISPDGKYLAFTATSGKLSRLWIRALNSFDAQPLAGTEGAAYPFWSPDSKSVGFFDRALKTIPVSGGPSQTICETQAVFGASWGRRGVIVFAQRPSGTLFRVPATGGTPVPVSVVDRAHGEIAHMFPYFLPDGIHFLYSVVSLAPAQAALRVGSLDSPQSSFLLNADLGGIYSPPFGKLPGAIVFGYHGALMSQPFSAETLKLTGTASPVAPEVRHVRLNPDVSVSAQGTLAYQPNSEKARQLTWFDRSGTELATAGEPNDYESISLSPDEEHLAVEALDTTSGRAEIWILDLKRGALSKMGHNIEEGFTPVWSPDGTEIAFAAATNSVITLARQRVNGLRAENLAGPRGVLIVSDWSADGKFLAYSRFQSEQGVWIRSMADSAADTGRPYSMDAPDLYRSECCAAFSPVVSANGPRWMAYSSYETGQSEVYVKNFPAGDRKWQVSTAGGWMPHWRADGKELFYLAEDGKLMAANILPAPEFRCGTPKPLFETTIAPYGYPTLPGNLYAVSRDGQRFLVNYAPRRVAPLIDVIISRR